MNTSATQLTTIQRTLVVLITVLVYHGLNAPMLFAQTAAFKVDDAASTNLMTLDTDAGLVVKGIIGAGSIPATGAGARMMWYPGKSAFRAGQASNIEWDNASVGSNSIAMGYGTTASGSSSTALGFMTIASGSYSTAMGNHTTASNNSSTAMGYETEASGSYSTTMGFMTAANAPYSTAMGRGTLASGNYSLAIGYFTLANGSYSTAMGYGSIASGGASIAMGNTTAAGGEAAMATGLETHASGNYSVSMGYMTTASGIASMSTGYSAEASGNYSASMGYITTASGYASTAMGSNNTASGPSSTAMGYNTFASSFSSTAMGYFTSATDEYSTAMGSYTTASARYSTAMGYGTTASGNYSTAMGKYVSTNSKSGSCIIGDNSTATTTNSSADDEMTMRFDGGYRLFTKWDLSTGVSLGNGATSWGTISDRNRKENFTPVDGDNILSRVRALPITEWNYKGCDPSIRYIGPMAQDFHAAFRLAGDDSLTITTLAMDGVLIASVQALEKRTSELKEALGEIEQLKSMVKNLALTNSDMQTRLAKLEAESEKKTSDNLLTHTQSSIHQK